MEQKKSLKAAVVLSGCGVYDGSEVHEAVVTLLNLQKNGVAVKFFAPDIEQAHVVNHLLGMPEEGERRRVLEESARIARGEISPLSEYKSADFDMLIFPGGFGAAKNLCTFAFDGPDCKVDPSVEKAVLTTLDAGKKLGFICISPVIGAKVIGGDVELTIGHDAGTAAAIEKMGARHIDCQADSYVKDSKREVYSTPAYMLAANVVELDKGIGAMISAMAK